MSEPASPAPACLLCGSARSSRLEVEWLPTRIAYYRCSDCAFMWVTDLVTGESHAVTITPKSPKQG